MLHIFHSMGQVTLYIAATVILFLMISLRTNPLFALGAFLQQIVTRPKYSIHFLAMLSILLINKLELWIEGHLHDKIDFTSKVYTFEGDFVAAFQNLFHNEVLTVITGFFYVVVFPAVLFTSMGVYTYQRNYRLFYALCYAMMINYAVAIPFYLFFNVNEVWYFHPDVKMLLWDIFPSFETDYRPLSGLDNCFPSLHTSISVTLAVIALQSRNKFWRIFPLISAVVIIFSIFYLGIHWLTDMCGGLLLGLFASTVGLKISEGKPVFENFGLGRDIKSRNIEP